MCGPSCLCAVRSPKIDPFSFPLSPHDPNITLLLPQWAPFFNYRHKEGRERPPRRSSKLTTHATKAPKSTSTWVGRSKTKMHPRSARSLRSFHFFFVEQRRENLQPVGICGLSIIPCGEQASTAALRCLGGRRRLAQSDRRLPQPSLQPALS